MSRAFTKEPDGSEPVDDLPELPVPAGRNLVTRAGLAQIEAHVQRLQGALAAARTDNDTSAIAHASRDLRYWQARRLSAEPIVPQPGDKVYFGMRVVLENDDGQTRNFRIVGQDEADAPHGLLSHASPLAGQLLGKSVGDTVTLGDRVYEIAAIDAT